MAIVLVNEDIVLVAACSRRRDRLVHHIRDSSPLKLLDDEIQNVRIASVERPKFFAEANHERHFRAADFDEAAMQFIL